MLAVNNDMIAAALPAVRYVAVTLAARGLPDGISLEDLESAGNEALIEAAGVHDPSLGSWLGLAKRVARNRMVDTIRAANRRNRGRLPLEHEHPDGSASPRPDPRAPDPAAAAAERDDPDAPRGDYLPAPRSKLAGPADVSRKVEQLREALYSALTPADLRSAVRAQVRKARRGSTTAFTALVGLVKPAGPSVQVKQQVALLSQSGGPSVTLLLRTAALAIHAAGAMPSAALAAALEVTPERADELLGGSDLFVPTPAGWGLSPSGRRLVG